MNEEVDVDDEIMGNQFNLVLKDSLLNTGLERIHANKRELRLNHLDQTLEKKKSSLRNNRNLTLPFEGNSSTSCRRSLENKELGTEQSSFEEA